MEPAVEHILATSEVHETKTSMLNSPLDGAKVEDSLRDMFFAQHQSGGSIDIIVTSDAKTERVLPVTEVNVDSTNQVSSFMQDQQPGTSEPSKEKNQEGI